MQKSELYLISPLDVGGDFPDRLAAALAAGPVSAFQFRVKGMDEHEAARLADPLQRLCDAHETAFVVNDSVSLAKRLRADGVHLGQKDDNAAEARDRLGRDVQIGVTCHASRHLALEAGDNGADYVAFGAFFPSTTKITEHRAEPEILDWWSSLVELPCVAIGGITAQNCAPLVSAGADFLAVSGAVWAYPEGPAAGVRAMLDAIEAASD